MQIGEICNREVVICDSGTAVSEAARLMRNYHVGSLVIVEERNGGRVPTGLVTDRDLVIEVLATDVAPEKLTVGDIRTTELTAVRATDDVFDALELMRRKGVRRMPVVDAQGALAGIVTLDDLLEILGEKLGSMVKLISREQLREKQSRRELPPETAARH